MSKITPLSSIPTLSQLFNSGSFRSNPTENAFKVANKVSLWQGDITTLEIDCIVNAANETLLGGGGVDGAIHRRAGPELLAECRILDGCETGQAKMTGAYDLPCKKVIHTVGPIYKRSKDDQCAELLQRAYRNSLQVAEKERLKSIAFPSISTGVYSFPMAQATEIAIQTVADHLSKHSDSASSQLQRVIFCVHSDRDLEVYREKLGELISD